MRSRSLGCRVAVPIRLLALASRGFHVIVPPAYRRLGCLPADQFIPDLMSHLGEPYYVGLLSAARLSYPSHDERCNAGSVSTQQGARPLRPVVCPRTRHGRHEGAVPQLSALHGQGRPQVTRAQFERNLHEKARSRGFRRDIQPLLRPEFNRDFDIDKALDIVRERLIRMLPGEPWQGVRG